MDDFSDLGVRAACARPFEDGRSTRRSVGITAADLAQLPDMRLTRSTSMTTKTGDEVGARSTRSQYTFDATEHVDAEKGMYPASHLEEEGLYNFDSPREDELYNAGIGPGSYGMRTRNPDATTWMPQEQIMHYRRKGQSPLLYDSITDRTVYTGGRRHTRE